MTTETFIDLAQSELSISGAASENASPVRRSRQLRHRRENRSAALHLRNRRARARIIAAN
ncbi:MAG: hypothetical protein DMF18_07845 [Verrucomicrobia bacterium]|nr:MAG: hypothetical protein DME73_05345 [Verrucomicrobiota bacterium]PYL95502.1 MAG: hypothetical protein DMF18_07845 [Verrucomicrobiota bacterium]